MKNCDTCIWFLKYSRWNDGRKGVCDCTDFNIVSMKGKPCKHYVAKKYDKLRNRRRFKQYIVAQEA